MQKRIQKDIRHTSRSLLVHRKEQQVR